jgi:hypothetical protein
LSRRDVLSVDATGWWTPAYSDQSLPVQRGKRQLFKVDDRNLKGGKQVFERGSVEMLVFVQ